MSIRDSVLEADSVSRTIVRAELLPGASAGTEVRLRTDAGRFAEATAASPRELTVKPNSRVVEATYVAPQRFGIATISVDVAGYIRRGEIRLVPARPASIVLNADKLVARANGTESIVFTARLLRPETRGAVSLGTRVDFVARDSTGQEIGRLRGATSVESASGTASYTLVTTVPQALSLQAVVGGDAGGVASPPLTVRFIAP